MMLEHVSGIAGVDEAGRGPLAGPVVAAVVIIPDGFDISGLNDSKKLTPAKRESLEKAIKEGTCWAIAQCDPIEIDRLNILQASLLAMTRAVEGLPFPPTEVWIDGNQVPKNLKLKARSVIKGDGKIAAIAAASILAKTCRDALMIQMAEQYPEYGFDKNFGYPTPDHLEALRMHGPCPIHRRSYAPVRACSQAEAKEQLCLTFDD